ncbi:MAG: cyclic nucleotide-binding domain-containing protein [Phycisphaerales bacterium]
MTPAVGTTHTSIGAPQRWDVPFGDMTERDVDVVLSMEPFASIDRSRFTPASPLEGIIRNDTRILRFDDGEIICREGDYSNSAFFICDGSVRVVLDSLPPETLGRRTSSGGVIGRTLARLWQGPRAPEARDVSAYGAHDVGSTNGRVRVFLQDIPRVLDSTRTVTIDEGEFFGEIAALGRTPRTATIIADGPCTLLEMRWQGLRDIRRRSDEIRAHIDRLYRERSLESHLRETPILAHLDDDSLMRVAHATQFESYGEFDWHVSYKKLAAKGAAGRFSNEPAIEQTGHYPNGLVLIRAGFARLSEPFAAGERTVSYLQRGDVFGLEEAHHNWKRDGRDETPYRRTLRALGYVDALRIPTKIVEEIILPSLPAHLVPPPIDAGQQTEQEQRLDPGLLEFLVEKRHVNGTQTMVIDTDRCTRCDDCVRACASTHDGNPRFLRHGPQHDRFMIANACMHCADPVCMIGCPTGAISRDPGTGSVVINDRTCIGCATCANSCPYSNIRMVEIRDDRGAPVLAQDTHLPILKATKCDLCADNAGGPACQRACPHDALRRVDMRDLETFAKWVNR